MDTRNRIVHGYDTINYPLLWDIVQDDIPPLAVTLAELLADPPPTGESGD